MDVEVSPRSGFATRLFNDGFRHCLIADSDEGLLLFAFSFRGVTAFDFFRIPAFAG